MNNILKIEKLNYKNILNDLNLTLEEKTFNILVGANGSGKTTLVKAILNFVNYSGTITFMENKIDETNIKEIIKNIGAISDFSSLLCDTVFDDLLTPLLNLDMEEDVAKQKIYSIAKKLNIENLLFKKVKELSYSQQKMILLCKSILHEPKLIIIDDSLQTLDCVYKKKFLNYINSMKKSTILFITNNSEYFSLADNIIFIKKGKIIDQLDKSNMFSDEKLFIKNGSELPFVVELSNKLSAYNLLDDICIDFSELVNKIWK